jgi:ribulose-phosphate 3-epimerase
MLEIIPSILTNDPKELKTMIKRCEDVVNRIHIDIIDTKFANNKTIDPSALEEIETNLKLDYHLMVKEPINWVERCVRGEADRIIAQIEMMSDQTAFVGKVQEVGAKIGLGIDLGTPVSKLDPVILTNLDIVLVMSVKAGFGGQPFDKRAIDKIKKLDEIRVRDDTPYQICDDGGITFEFIDDVHYTGAEEVAIGRRLFKGSLAKNLEKYQRAAHKLSLSSK